MALRAFVLLLAAITTAGLTACTPSAPGPSSTPISVFLTDTATAPQRQAVEAKIRAIPGATEVRFETREQAYERFKETFKDDPDMIAKVKPEALPESFKFTVDDVAPAKKAIAELNGLPGVASVKGPANAVPSPSPTAAAESDSVLPLLSGRNEIQVYLRDDASAAQKEAIKATLEATSGISGVRFETREQAYKRFKELFKDQPELLAKATPDALPESYVATAADIQAAVPLITSLRHMPGVAKVSP